MREFLVQRIFRQQALVTALGKQHPVIQYTNAISGADCGQSMSDNDYRHLTLEAI